MVSLLLFGSWLIVLRLRQNAWYSQWCYIVSSCCVRISVLLFYRRLSVSFTKTFVVATWVGIAFNVCYLITFLVVIGTLCFPLAAYWHQFNPEWLATHTFTCTKEDITLPTSGALSCLGDAYSTILPLLLIANLDFPKRQKLALYALFTLGFL
jgi:hypothetical protein